MHSRQRDGFTGDMCNASLVVEFVHVKRLHVKLNKINMLFFNLDFGYIALFLVIIIILSKGQRKTEHSSKPQHAPQYTPLLHINSAGQLCPPGRA